MKKVALVTGASSGIGALTAVDLQNAGFKVYGAARSIDKMKHLEEEGIGIIPLDVTDDVSCVSCMDLILEKEGRIDVLVNNAGYGSYGAIEDVPIEEAKHQFDVNLFGLARLIQLVLPIMRKQKTGTIINISSMAGKVHTPFGAWYHASKFALEGFTDCLRLEVETEFGINVVLIEPGGIKTPWGLIAAENLIESSKGGAYEESANRVAKTLKKAYEGDSLSSPSLISQTIVTAATSRKPKTRYLVGANAKTMVFMRSSLSDHKYDAVIKKIFKM